MACSASNLALRSAAGASGAARERETYVSRSTPAVPELGDPGRPLMFDAVEILSRRSATDAHMHRLAAVQRASKGIRVFQVSSDVLEAVRAV